jgi:DNA-binding MarR family transcriptional regulator
MTKPATADLARPSAAGVPLGAASPAFLLAQVGAHAATQFGERLMPLGLAPTHAGLLRIVHASEGLSQQALCARLGLAPSRVVALVDDLEQRGLVIRRDHPHDRRSYALYLTDDGRNALKSIGKVAREHQDALCAALNADERAHLASLLTRIAKQQGLTAGVHPGFSRERG